MRSSINAYLWKVIASAYNIHKNHTTVITGNANKCFTNSKYIIN